MSIISPYDREELRAQFRGSAPFPWVKIDGFLEPDFATEVASAYPSYESALGMGKQFKAVNESGKIQIVDYSLFPRAVKQLSDALASSSFRDDLAYATGIPDLIWDASFVGGGMHETARSGWLDVHVDFNLHDELKAHRRLNILIFLNPEWNESWGGMLELWDKGVKRCVHSLAPIHNRCVVFETSESSWHGVTAVQCPEGVVRKSYAAYYYTSSPPGGWAGKSHTTVFRARPSEHLKRYAFMPVVSVQSSMRAGVRAARRVAKKLLGRPAS